MDDPDDDLDDDDDEGGAGRDGEEGAGGNDDIVIALYEKVQRVKNKWKVTLKDGLVAVNGREYLFNKCSGYVLRILLPLLDPWSSLCTHGRSRDVDPVATSHVASSTRTRIRPTASLNGEDALGFRGCHEVPWVTRMAAS